MQKEEYKQLKTVLETENFCNNTHNAKQKLSCWLKFLTLTKDFNSFEIFKNRNTNVWSFLLRNYNFEKSKLNYELYKQFIQDGYLFHITKEANKKIILEKGILTLHERFGNEMYRDCCELNHYWRNMAKKMHNVSSCIIIIPNKDRIYKKRFESVYLTTDIDTGIEYYGNGMELFNIFIDSLMENIKLPYGNKYEERDVFRKEIVMQLNTFDKITEVEKQVILNFYDKYYEKMSRGILENKTIIMVPQKKIIQQNSCSEDYQQLIKNPYHFYDYYINCNDIEYKGNISNEGLIAITLNETNQSKIKIKVEKANNKRR